MRLALLVTLIALTAGCFGEDAPAEVQEEPQPEPIPQLPAGVLVVTPPAPGATASTAEVTLGLELRDMDFANNLTRVAIIANGSARVKIDHWVAMPTSYQTDACAVGAVSIIEDNNVSKNMLTSLWMRPQRADFEVRGGGMGAGTADTYGDTTAGDRSFNWTGAYQLRAGDMVLLEMGGGDPSFFNATTQDGVQNPSLRYNVTASGPVRIEALPAREFRCGTGSYQAAGTFHAHGKLTDVAIDTRIALNVTTAGTIRYSAGVAGDAKRVDVTFLDDTYENAKAVSEAREGSGEIAIQFNAWTDAAGESRWLMADAYWPAIKG